jgi:dTDP-4-amino-4,6-dideoxygalactose transaminase
MIPLFKVFMPGSVLGPINKTLLSGFIGQGPKVDEFEGVLGDFLQYKSIVTVNTGTGGLHLALRLLGIGPGDEVLSSSLTCAATNWPVVLAGADIKWCDVQLHSCNIDPKEIINKISEKTKAILFVHWGGYPADLAEIELAAGDIPIIEDCAHAFGSSYMGKPIGSSGNYCMFSFQAIKILNTVDGGCLTVPHNQLKRAKLLRWYGMDREDKTRLDFRCEADVPEVGDKLHMNDVCATIGIEQMKYIEKNRYTQIGNARFYDECLKDFPEIQLIQQARDRQSNYWLYTIRVNKRDDFMKAMKDRGVMTSRVHERNDKHSCVAKYRTELPNVDTLVKDMVCIPVGWWVSLEDRQYIVDCIKKGW